jgi:DDE family transposase
MVTTPASNYPEHLRRIRLRDTETGRSLVFLTNQFGLPAATICALYKSRWQVELFFKWIKQHLRIKRFFGASENAVKTQIWIAVSVYVLVAIVKKRLTLDASLYTLLQILSVTLFEKIPVDQALAGDDGQMCPRSGMAISPQIGKSPPSQQARSALSDRVSRRGFKQLDGIARKDLR